MSNSDKTKFVAGPGVTFITLPCDTCRRRNPMIPGCCDAFPTGIPAVVLRGENDHEEPIDGDGGLTYDGVDVLPDAALMDEIL